MLLHNSCDMVMVVLMFLCCWKTNGLHKFDDKVLDEVVKNDKFVANELKKHQLLTSKEDQSSPDERDLEEIEVQQRKEDDWNKNVKNEDREKWKSDRYEDQHFIGSRDSKVFFLENILRDIMNKYDVNGKTKHRSRCPLFIKPTSHSKTKCGSTKTMFGKISWCHVQCDTGYKLKEEIPQYELCGESTRFRWTYELRGFSMGTERCIAGTRIQNMTSVCTTKECFATAAYYMNRIDFTVNPCNDFYSFACGRWMKENPIPPSKNKLDTFTIIRDRVVSNVADLLAQPYKAGECAAVKKAKIAYKACMNTDLINKLDDKPLKKLLAGRKTMWPMIEKTWKTSGLFVEKAWAKLRGLYNIQLFMEVTVARKNGTYVLQTRNGGLALPTSYYLDKRHEDKLKAYYDLMRDIALMLGGNVKTVTKDIKSVKKFERKLAFHKAHDKLHHTVMTFQELQLRMPGEMDWLNTFQRMILTQPISKSTIVHVWNGEFMKNLQVLVKSAGRRTVQNYIFWRLVKQRINNLSLRFHKRYLMFEKAMFGTISLPSRQYKCASELILSLKGATSKLYIDKYFSSAEKAAATKLFTYIRDGFLKLLDREVTWMDKKTKAYAIKKANAIIYDIGYNPHIYQNTTYLDKQVSNLRVNVRDYFGNTLRTLTTIAQDRFELLGQHYDPTVVPFTCRPTMPNAIYSNTNNRIMLLAAMMQYPYYWGDNFSQFFQYGAIGSIMGHELTRGFDNTGRLYDLRGNKLNWWSAQSVAQFKKRTTCLVNQYNNFYSTEAGILLNGTRTLTENIADIGGIRASYAGYHLWLKSKGLSGEKIEPATGFNNNQMFFIGAASAQCGHSTHASAVHEVTTDTHSPLRFRVIGSFQNFDKFAEAFHCPSGSYMNPIKKCIVW